MYQTITTFYQLSIHVIVTENQNGEFNFKKFWKKSMACFRRHWIAKCHELFFNKMKIWAQMYPDKCKRVKKACFLNFPCIFYIAVTNFYKIQFFFLMLLACHKKSFLIPLSAWKQFFTENLENYDKKILLFSFLAFDVMYSFRVMIHLLFKRKCVPVKYAH